MSKIKTIFDKNPFKIDMSQMNPLLPLYLLLAINYTFPRVSSFKKQLYSTQEIN